MKKMLVNLVLNLTHTEMKPVNKSVNTSSTSLSMLFLHQQVSESQTQAKQHGLIS